MFEAIQSLFVYGAGGLLVLGLFINSETGSSTSFFPILWVAGSLFVYNLDRLIPDPADLINNPTRTKYQSVRIWTIYGSLVTLGVVPLISGRWSLLIPLATGTAFCSLYSVAPPIVECRIKDVPLLKWIIPPVIVLISLTAPNWLMTGALPQLLGHWPLLLGLFAGLLINILLFDQRDRQGDMTVGSKTIATETTPETFRLLLIVLFALQTGVLFFHLTAEMFAFTSYTGGLIVCAAKKRANWFYNWAVDGMLFVPWICKCLFGKLG